MMRSSVVLPQPEGPSRATNSPSATVSDTSLQRAEGAEILGDPVDDDIGHGTPPLLARDAPHREQVAPDREDEEHRRDDQDEAAGEAVVQRALRTGPSADRR